MLKLSVSLNWYQKTITKCILLYSLTYDLLQAKWAKLQEPVLSALCLASWNCDWHPLPRALLYQPIDDSQSQWSTSPTHIHVLCHPLSHYTRSMWPERNGRIGGMPPWRKSGERERQVPWPNSGCMWGPLQEVQACRIKQARFMWQRKISEIGRGQFLSSVMGPDSNNISDSDVVIAQEVNGGFWAGIHVI